MRPASSLAAGLLAVGSASAEILGFNSGATLANREAKFKADFKAEFETAQGLANAPGKFNSVRLYTNVQAYSKDDPIEAFEAAMETGTTMLLGIWTSGTASIANELSALKKAVDKHGKKFTDLVIGMSIGSEDLYRNSATGIENKAGVGNQPAEIVKFINEFKKAFANTALASTPVGHVDTWDVWVNATNSPVLDAVDWIGVDEYPYYEGGKGNDIKNAGKLFDRAFDAVVAVSNGKPVWLTETGWPTEGPNWDLAVSSVDNAKYYWNEIGCRKLFGKVPTFWYNLRDSNPDNEMKFAITKNLSTKPLFDLTCPTTFDTPSGTSSASSPSNTGATTPSGSGSAQAGSGSTTTSSASSSSSSSAAVSGVVVKSGASLTSAAFAAALLVALI